MIELRRADTDAELEAWRLVRLAVQPNERVSSVEELRAAETPDRLLLLATLDGEICGSGSAGRSDLAGRASLFARVLPRFRRRGAGTALLSALAAHVHALGFDEVGSGVEDSGSLAFAERFGFREVDRQIEQVRTVGDEPEPEVPAGVEIVSLEQRPELWRAVYETVAPEAFADMALDTPLEIPVEQWEGEWMTCPAATFVAVAGGEAIGCAGLQPDEDEPARAENALTAVRRDWRARGVALALKRTALRWAEANGVVEVSTWTQQGNESMLRLNERLGYVNRSESISVRAALPIG